MANVAGSPISKCYTESIEQKFKKRGAATGRAFAFGFDNLVFGWDGTMTRCIGFRTFKERGEWVELVFMAMAVRLGFRVSKPWGDSSAYDVGVESGERILRVQVKSTDCRTQYGWLCQFKPNARSKPYTLKQVDFLRRM